ncbi:MAG TPA: metallophosphoesterase family protein [Bacteroidia bacterium]|nr:metallophosphoesterase family protein [Bacteroidia bacterium]
MTNIGLLSDTHGYIDERIISHLEDCDEIWHAGDIGDIELAQKLESLKPLKAVYGNIDGTKLRMSFPEDLVFECEKLKVFITHIGGYPGNYPSKLKNKIQELKPDLFICGHSHILKVMPDKINKLLHMNPGAAGKHGFHKIRTLLKFSVNGKKIENVRVVELGQRGEIENV